MPNIKNRAIQSDQVRDPSSIDAITYNEKAGAFKNSEVGRALIPLGDGAGGYTTNATAPKVLPSAGKNVAIYNNSAAVHSATVGDSSMTPQAAGTVQVTASGVFVGVPCPPNQWTYLAAAQWNWVATDSASLLVFIIDDATYIVTQPANNAST